MYRYKCIPRQASFVKKTLIENQKGNGKNVNETTTTREHVWAPSAGVFPFESRETLDKKVIPLESNGDPDEFTNQLEYDKGIENSEKLVDKRKVERP